MTGVTNKGWAFLSFSKWWNLNYELLNTCRKMWIVRRPPERTWYNKVGASQSRERIIVRDKGAWDTRGNDLLFPFAQWWETQSPVMQHLQQPAHTRWRWVLHYLQHDTVRKNRSISLVAATYLRPTCQESPFDRLAYKPTTEIYRQLNHYWLIIIELNLINTLKIGISEAVGEPFRNSA